MIIQKQNSDYTVSLLFNFSSFMCFTLYVRYSTHWPIYIYNKPLNLSELSLLTEYCYIKFSRYPPCIL